MILFFYTREKIHYKFFSAVCVQGINIGRKREVKVTFLINEKKVPIQGVQGETLSYFFIFLLYKFGNM